MEVDWGQLVFALALQPGRLCLWRMCFPIFSAGQALRLFWAGNWKQVWTSPPPAPPAPPGLGARGDRQEIYEQLELAAIFRGREHGVNQGSHCVRAGRAL